MATVPMTAFMLAVHQFLPKWQQYAVPPQRITDKLAERVGIRPHVDSRLLVASALLSHFGYGTALGVVYAHSVRRLWPNVFPGVQFGLMVWAASYLGWLPLAGILPPATKRPRGRAMMMVLSHVVYGASLAIAANVCDRRIRAGKAN